jgi:anti-sigma regulatory factor (Ser/Thr protein kinase)
VLRSYAWQRQSPAGVLDSLDQLVQGLEMAQLATAVFGRLELLEAADGRSDGARLRWANAGHLPPLVVLPDGRVERLADAWSVLIGAPGGTPRPECDVMLPPGATLVLFTDGLVESRRDDVDAGLDRLATVLAGVADAPTAHDLCDRLLAGLDPESREDDLALLVVRLADETVADAEDEPARSTLEVPAVPASVSRVRRHCRTALADAPEDVADTVVLLASELASNAVSHAAGPIALSVDHGARVVRVEVADRSAHLPVPRAAGAPEPGLDEGRGLLLLEALAGSWGAVPTAAGKRVWFEVPLP